MNKDIHIGDLVCVSVGGSRSRSSHRRLAIRSIKNKVGMIISINDKEISIRFPQVNLTCTFETSLWKFSLIKKAMI